MSKNNLFKNDSYTPSDLASFFLGLFEGAGGVYFRKTKNKYRPFFLILLDDHLENKAMLEYLNVRLELKASVHHKKAGKKSQAKIVMQGGSYFTMCALFDIVNKYDLVTSKKIVMFEILMKCGIWPNVGHKAGKNKKIYLLNPVVIDKHEQNRVIDHYSRGRTIGTASFKPWLSGFLETKAGFGFYAGGDIRMTIYVQNDHYLINEIKQHFQSRRKIVKDGRGAREGFSLTLEKASFNRIVSHFQRYPFVGFQKTVYDQFCKRYPYFPERKRIPVPTLKSPMVSYTQDYIDPFFVGLLDGDGSISLGRTKGGNLSYGVFKIGLKYSPENHAMLSLIKDHIGGSINYHKKKKGNPEIRWTAASQNHVKRVLAILEKYPLLTSRKICQLHYLKQCMLNRSWKYHLETRDLKYLQQDKWIMNFKRHFEIPHYFGPWFSGFFEAEGCFRAPNQKSQSVYIGQNHDSYLLNAIKTYFQSHHKIGLHKDVRRITAHYRLSMSGKPTLERIIKHFIKYPLLGYKKVQFDLFRATF